MSFSKVKVDKGIAESNYDTSQIYPGEFVIVLPVAHPLFPRLTGFIGIVEELHESGAGAHVLLRGQAYLIPYVCLSPIPDDMVELSVYSDGIKGYKFTKAAKQVILDQNKNWLLIGTHAFDLACKMACETFELKKINKPARKRAL